MTVLTVSRQMGSQGDVISAAVASQLGYRMVDRELLREAAEQAGVPRIAFEEMTYEGERNLVDEMLGVLQSMPSTPVAPEASRADVIGPFTFPFGGAFASAVPPVSSLVEAMEGYLHILQLTIEDLAREGNVLLLGQGGRWIVGDLANTIHVLVVAAMEDRIAAVARHRHMDPREAERQVRASDRSRAAFHRRNFKARWLDPFQYHLCINTSQLSTERAVEVLVATARADEPPAEETFQGASSDAAGPTSATEDRDTPCCCE
jgi:cytidylate kinase